MVVLTHVHVTVASLQPHSNEPLQVDGYQELTNERGCEEVHMVGDIGHQEQDDHELKRGGRER